MALHLTEVTCAKQINLTGHRLLPGPPCRELTTLWVARLNEGTELKVTDPKEQHRDVDEEEAKDEERRERVDYGGRQAGCC